MQAVRNVTEVLQSYKLSNAMLNKILISFYRATLYTVINSISFAVVRRLAGSPGCGQRRAVYTCS